MIRSTDKEQGNLKARAAGRRMRKSKISWSPTSFVVLFVILISFGALFFLQSGGEPAPSTVPAAKISKEEVFLEKSARLGIPRAYAKAYFSSAKKEGLQPEFLAALGYAESNHGTSSLPGVRSGLNSAGCCAGPMQICSVGSCGDVASTYGRDEDGSGEVDIYDTEDAVATAARYLSWIQGQVGKDERLLAASYNAGPTIVAQLGRVPSYPETISYVQKVLRYQQKFAG